MNINVGYIILKFIDVVSIFCEQIIGNKRDTYYVPLLFFVSSLLADLGAKPSICGNEICCPKIGALIGVQPIKIRHLIRKKERIC